MVDFIAELVAILKLRPKNEYLIIVYRANFDLIFCFPVIVTRYDENYYNYVHINDTRKSLTGYFFVFKWTSTGELIILHFPSFQLFLGASQRRRQK